jgi:hypothetical protein
MTTYQFTLIERLVDTDISVTALATETNRIIRDLPAIIYALDDTIQRKDFTRYHQHRLILLMNSIASRLPDHLRNALPETASGNELQQCYNHLEDLLRFLTSDYGHLVDNHLQVPHFHYLRARVSIADRLAKISEELTVAGVPADTLHVILHPYANCLTGTPDNYGLTYHQLTYLDELLRGLHNLSATLATPMQNIENLLISLNHNTPEYYQYIINTIEQDLSDIPDVTHKLYKVMALQKSVNQQPVWSDCGFDPDGPSLKQLLLNWLQEEYQFLQHLQQTAATPQPPADMVQWQHFKIVTALSVHQLAHLFGLLMEAGVITNKNKSEISDFISVFFSSSKQQDIAAGSLRKKMYDATPSVVKAVRDTLHQLIRHSHQNELVGRPKLS